MINQLLYETMTRAESKQYICRIWRDHPFIGPSNEMIKEIAEVRLSTMYVNIYEVISELIRFDGVNSVEIVSRQTGCGMCVHKDWP